MAATETIRYRLAIPWKYFNRVVCPFLSGRLLDETFCTICYHLYNLSNLKNTHEGALLLVKLPTKVCY